jgi:hypothetical protein
MEEDDRIQIESSYWRLETAITDSLQLTAQGAFDAVTGATPTGAPPPPGSNEVPVVEIEDNRAGGFVQLEKTWGIYTLGAQVAASVESDYESIAFTLNHQFSLNKKTTTLLAGASATFDEIEAVTMENGQGKDSFDFILGVNQILTPTTTLQVNFTYGFGDGYFTDPYRIALVDGFFQFENRPDYKDKRIVYAALRQFIPPLDAGIEADYRYYEDSFGFESHTATARWHQHIGNHLVVSPMFRYHQQTEAEFYGVTFEGAPRYFSSDWRMSAFETISYGVQAVVFWSDEFSLDFTYERYDVDPRDGETPRTVYVGTDVYTFGGTVRF